MTLVHLLCPCNLEESQQGGGKREVLRDRKVMAAPTREVPLHRQKALLLLHVNVSQWAWVVVFFHPCAFKQATLGSHGLGPMSASCH